MVDRAFIGASTHGSVSKGNKLGVVRLKNLPGLIGGFLEHDDHEAAHKEGSVRLLGVVERRVVVDLVTTVLGIVHELLKLLAEKVDLSEI